MVFITRSWSLYSGVSTQLNAAESLVVRAWQSTSYFANWAMSWDFLFFFFFLFLGRKLWVELSWDSKFLNHATRTNFSSLNWILGELTEFSQLIMIWFELKWAIMLGFGWPIWFIILWWWGTDHGKKIRHWSDVPNCSFRTQLFKWSTKNFLIYDKPKSSHWPSMASVIR